MTLDSYLLKIACHHHGRLLKISVMTGNCAAHHDGGSEAIEDGQFGDGAVFVPPPAGVSGRVSSSHSPVNQVSHGASPRRGQSRGSVQVSAGVFILSHSFSACHDNRIQLTL